VHFGLRYCASCCWWVCDRIQHNEVVDSTEISRTTNAYTELAGASLAFVAKDIINELLRLGFENRMFGGQAICDVLSVIWPSVFARRRIILHV
jgi:hypothetical protein